MMNPGIPSRINGWRYRKKPPQGVAGYEKPQVPTHVTDSDPPEVFVSKLNGRQPSKAPDSSVASPATALSDDSESGSKAKYSITKVVVGHESPPTDSEFNSIDSKVGETLTSVERPENFQTPSMSVLSQVDSNNAERIALSSSDDSTYHPRDSDGAHFTLDLQDTKSGDFLARLETSSLPTRLETKNVSRLNGKNPKMGSSPKLISDFFPQSTSGTSPNAHSALTPDHAGNGPLSDSIPDELHLQGSVFGISDHQAPLANIRERPKSTPDNPNPQTALNNNSDHPQYILDETERLMLNHPEYFPEQTCHSPHTTKAYHPDSIYERAEHQDPNLVTLDQPVFSPDGQGLTGPISAERNRLRPILDEELHPASILENYDHSDRIDDVQSFPRAISNTQSRSESTDSHEFSNGPDQQPSVGLEAKLHRFRWRSLKFRALVAEKRTELGELRSDISKADAEFIKMNRESRVNGSHDGVALEASWKKLQDLRDAYGPLEWAYNILEERLDREEYELADLEESMVKSGLTTPESHESDLESHLESSDQEHPLVKEFRSKLDDSALVLEAYTELMVENDNLLEVKEASEKTGKKLTLETETTLAKFYAEQDKLLRNSEQISVDVERLRRECTVKGLMPVEEVGENDILQNSDGSIDLEQAEYNKYPRLLARPGEGKDEEESKRLLSQFKPGDTGDRITRWLLHKLRSSCSEVELLARYSDGLDRSTNTQKWQEEVLYFWFMDSTNLPPSAYELNPTPTATPSTTITDPTKVPPKLFGEKHFIQLLVRSSSLSRSLEFGLLLKLAQLKGRSAVTM